MRRSAFSARLLGLAFVGLAWAGDDDKAPKPKKPAPPAAAVPKVPAQPPKKTVPTAPKRAADPVKALSGHVDVEFKETPLADVVSFLREFTGANVVMDREGLADAMVDPDTTTVNLQAEGTVEEVLELFLERCELVAVPKGNVLLITSRDKMHGMMFTAIYPVGDLFDDVPAPVPPMPRARGNAPQAGHDDGKKPDEKPKAEGDKAAGEMGGGGMGGGAAVPEPPSTPDAVFIRILENCVARDTWEVNGGEGTIAYHAKSKCVVARQNYAVHRELKKFLADLRTATKAAESAAPTKSPTR